MSMVLRSHKQRINLCLIISEMPTKKRALRKRHEEEDIVENELGNFNISLSGLLKSFFPIIER